MKLYSDIKTGKAVIINSIKKFGYLPEHNYYHHLYMENKNYRALFFSFSKNAGVIGGIKGNVWYFTTEVLAPKNERTELFCKALDYALKKEKAKKVVVEAGEGFRKEILAKLSSKYKIVSLNYSLYWPIYNLVSQGLKGKKWKKLRNLRNGFYKNYKIEVKDAKSINKKYLSSILSLWVKRRAFNDRVDTNYYKNIIGNKFKGFGMANSILLNGVPCCISAGWKIPNSSSFYWAIGIHNYSHKNLGDFANLQDIIAAKNKGHSFVDLGGSLKNLLYSKMKLKPEKIYKTYVFSIKAQ